ncbi:MAG TPA: DUF1449 family protein [Leptolyngbyaceae cyanobacterium M33_DOE_097]|uniref:DUF1449 family protein n=1 Tax=Oscillatoriales cyanobacterium SpSt-418 TaxID=2282169 RepID=A0A7C3KCZ5_9CYAN|nr:DUF1449 family protein [Leptolyngbyaceae cyanobacterium M33_DOE_097]
MLFSLVNLPYWICLAAGVLLYLMVIVTGGGDDQLDTDVDADVDADADADSGELGFLDFLGWFGFGKAPLILLLATNLSLLGVIGWMLNLALGLPTGFQAGLLFVLATAIALLLGSLIARPLGQVFAQFGEDASSDRLIGCVGTVSSLIVPTCRDGRIGQVDVFDTAHNLVSVPAVLPEWSKVLPKRGEKVLVIDRQPEFYVVVAKDSADSDYWFNQSSQK